MRSGLAATNDNNDWKQGFPQAGTPAALRSMTGNRLKFSKYCTDGPEFFISGQNYCHDHANHLKDMKGLWRSKASRQAVDIHERHTEFMNGKSEASKRGGCRPSERDIR
jgi:hypothetical protein